MLSGKGAEGRAVFQFAGEDGKFLVGVAEYLGEAELQLRDWPFDESMFFLAGELEIVSESGRKTVVRAGEAVVPPKGFNGSWKELSPINKISVMYDGDGHYQRSPE